MKSRKYPSLQEAIADLEKQGELIYKGHEGLKMIYTLQIVGHNKYILFIHEDGLVELAYEV
jgi:hypothetical protein